MHLLAALLAIGLQLPASTWVCPMHPEVRTEEAGKCPRCGMALVVMKPDTHAAYLLDVQRDGPVTTGRPLELSFFVRHPVTKALVTDYLVVHERPVHIFAVSSDLRVFEHLHPDAASDGRLRLRWQPPRPGRYHFFLDIVPVGALPQLLEAVVAVPGDAAPLTTPPPGVSASVGGVKAEVSSDQTFAGRWTRLTVQLTDVATGKPLTDWEPWLGAWAHLFTIREGATEPLHAHPDDDSIVREHETTAVTFDVLFPRAGRYGVWIQIQRAGSVITLPFSVEIEGWTVARR